MTTCARAVEGTDERQRQDALPELHHGRGQLEHLRLLPPDDLFAAELEDLSGVQTELVDDDVETPDLAE